MLDGMLVWRCVCPSCGMSTAERLTDGQRTILEPSIPKCTIRADVQGRPGTHSEHAVLNGFPPGAAHRGGLK